MAHGVLVALRCKMPAMGDKLWVYLHLPEPPLAAGRVLKQLLLGPLPPACRSTGSASSSLRQKCSLALQRQACTCACS